MFCSDSLVHPSMVQFQTRSVQQSKLRQGFKTAECVTGMIKIKISHFNAYFYAIQQYCADFRDSLLSFKDESNRTLISQSKGGLQKSINLFKLCQKCQLWSINSKGSHAAKSDLKSLLVIRSYIKSHMKQIFDMN